MRNLLAQLVQKLGPHYILLDDQKNPTVQIGQPVIESLDNVSGVVTIKIAAAPSSKVRAGTHLSLASVPQAGMPVLL